MEWLILDTDLIVC